MHDLSDIQNTWFTAKVNALPKASEVVKTIKRYRAKQIMKSTFLILLSLVLAMVMIYVVFFYQSNMLITRIGEILMLTAIFILISANAVSLTRISRSKNYSNNEFLNYLKQEQQRLLSFQKRTQATGFVLSSAGLLLYLFEGVYRQPGLMIVTYVFAILFILVCWFIVRPAAIKRKTKKLKQAIGKLETLSDQLKND